jgi:hypothetical protein
MKTAIRSAERAKFSKKTYGVRTRPILIGSRQLQLDLATYLLNQLLEVSKKVF